MTDGFVIGLAQDTLLTTIMVSAPMLGLSLIIGLLVSIFQTTTSIQEQTLTFVPKIIVVLLSVVVFGPWMLNSLNDFVIRIFRLLPEVARW